MINPNKENRFSKKIVWLKLAGIVLVVAVISVPIIILNKYVPGAIGLELFAVFFGAVMFIPVLLDYLATTFNVGSNSITLSRGVVNRYSKAIAFDRIQDIEIARSLVYRLFGLSKVNIRTAVERKNTDIPDMVLILDREKGEWLKNFILDRKTNN